MDSFSISDLSRYSGIKQHTIRIWEKRYHALKPGRSSGNTRNYDSTQLKRLLIIAGLLKSDFKVSELCAMTDEKLYELSAQMQQVAIPAPSEYFISQLISSALTYDESQFVNIFSHCLLRYGIKETYVQVLYPALIRIGLMWLNDALPTANEHFVSNLIRQKLFTAIDALPMAKPDRPAWVLFLPEDEFHDIGLLLAHYLIRLSGQRVIYMGGNVHESSVRAAVDEIKPENLLLFFVRENIPGDIKKYLTRLIRDLKVKEIHVAVDGRLAYQLRTMKRIHFLGSMESLSQYLTGQDV